MLTRYGVLDAMEAPKAAKDDSRGISLPLGVSGILVCTPACVHRGSGAWTGMRSKPACPLGKGLFARQMAGKCGQPGGNSWERAMRK